MVLRDEYRINGVNAMCKRAIAPTALPLPISLPALALLLSVWPLGSPSNCTPDTRPIGATKRRWNS